MRWLLLLLLILPAWADEVSFTCGPDTLYGTLLRPATSSGPAPGLLLLSGSGPTDRDGNSRLLPGKIDTEKHFAEVLAGAGVVTLRYDKLFSGKTGAATHAGNIAQVGLDTYVDEAQAALDFLRQQPGVDPDRLAVLGHSEGGLIALVLATQRQPAGLKALVLAAPLSIAYLQTLHDQIAGQYAAAVKAGHLKQAEADAGVAALDKVLAALKASDGHPDLTGLPEPLKAIFNPLNDHFLHTAGAFDPAVLAGQVKQPVLVLDGDQDVQVTPAMVDHLMSGFLGGNATRVLLPGVDHVFKVVGTTPNPATDYTDPSKKFSPEADQALVDFVRKTLF